MKRLLLAASLVVVAILAIPSLASAAGGMRSCGGAGMSRVYASPSTSCAMAKATAGAVGDEANRHGETPSGLYVRSPATGKRYYMFIDRKVRHGGIPFARYRAAGAAVGDVRVDLWIP